jgi:hypothetical protein
MLLMIPTLCIQTRLWQAVWAVNRVPTGCSFTQCLFPLWLCCRLLRVVLGRIKPPPKAKHTPMAAYVLYNVWRWLSSPPRFIAHPPVRADERIDEDRTSNCAVFNCRGVRLDVRDYVRAGHTQHPHLTYGPVAANQVWDSTLEGRSPTLYPYRGDSESPQSGQPRTPTPPKSTSRASHHPKCLQMFII